jgi:hypothetical protein
MSDIGAIEHVRVVLIVRESTRNGERQWFMWCHEAEDHCFAGPPYRMLEGQRGPA